MTIKQASEISGLSADTLRYYEKVGMIPPVPRSAGGVRDYQQEDLSWIALAKCMRAAGLPVEVMVEYLKLYLQGDATIAARLALLTAQRHTLLEQRRQVDETLERINYKISIYETAVQLGTMPQHPTAKKGEV